MFFLLRKATNIYSFLCKCCSLAAALLMTYSRFASKVEISVNTCVISFSTEVSGECCYKLALYQLKTKLNAQRLLSLSFLFHSYSNSNIIM